MPIYANYPLDRPIARIRSTTTRKNHHFSINTFHTSNYSKSAPTSLSKYQHWTNLDRYNKYAIILPNVWMAKLDLNNHATTKCRKTKETDMTTWTLVIVILMSGGNIPLQFEGYSSPETCLAGLRKFEEDTGAFGPIKPVRVDFHSCIPKS